MNITLVIPMIFLGLNIANVWGRRGRSHELRRRNHGGHHQGQRRQWDDWDNYRNGVGSNARDPCSQQGVVFIEAPNINAPDVEACRQECEDDEDCQFFAFNTLATSGANCGLRYYYPFSIVTVNGQRAGYYSSVVEKKNVVLVGFAPKTDTMKECQYSCEANYRCRTWSWTNADGSNPLVCVHNYGIADTVLKVRNTTTSGRTFCNLTS